ncbi:rRNA maturation RNase YbeY [Desulfovibrio sp.]|uniref:rRNA maturation RNase YbeY n=1 Tax=Desulfovibrio sp. TaxID=885 RepID=UPI0023D42FBC|nr:rRNA maturation RNase YbeY [Desulfovibrio sp.]MDE7240508.1 rRNA maturation RNase YbeY [Desulfovibrio sp.]
MERHGGAAWLCPLDRRELKLALAAMCAGAAALGRPVAGVDLYLITDEAMARANAQHLGCTGPTNVLSFPGASGMAGALLLSLDTLERECLLYGQQPVEHLLRLLAHGMGHLAGLDHGPEMDALCASCLEAAEAGLAL